MAQGVLLITVEAETLSLPRISLGCSNRFSFVKVFLGVGEHRGIGCRGCKGVLFCIGLRVCKGGLGFRATVGKFRDGIFKELSSVEDL